MRAQLKKSFKGTVAGKPCTWDSGKIFDDSEEPIPTDIMHEIRAGNPNIVMLGDFSPEKAKEGLDKQVQGLLEENRGLQEDLASSQKLREDAEKRVKELENELALKHDEIEKLKKDAAAATAASQATKFTCPVEGCEKTFNSEQALKVHLTRVHSDFKPPENGGNEE